MTSAVKPGAAASSDREPMRPVTVRQTPLTQIESPMRASLVTTELRT